MRPRIPAQISLAAAAALLVAACGSTHDRYEVLSARPPTETVSSNLPSDLYGAAEKARLDRKGWEVDGRALRIIRWSNDGVVLRDDRRAEDFDFAWNALPLGWQDDLLTRGRARDTANLIELAEEASDAGRHAMAGRLLGEAAKDKAAQEKATKLLPGYELKKDVYAPEDLDVDALNDLLKDLEKNAGRAGREQSKRQDEAFRTDRDKLANMDAYSRESAVALLNRLRNEELADGEGATGLSKDLDKLIAARAELDKARQHALELIEDETAWPYPYGPDNDNVTADVMRRVDAVRKQWENSYRLKGRATRHPEVVFQRVRMFQDAIDELDPDGAWSAPVSPAYLDYVKALANQTLTVQNFATTQEEIKQVAWNQAVRTGNAALEATSKKDKTGPDAGAWLQLAITNDYREMMGRRRLKMNYKLYWAAAHHSEYCMTDNKGQIAHVIEGEPRGETPQMRAQDEGYSGLCGENISYITANTPMKSHNGWLESSGHHRNILDARWRVMGNGRSGPIWTQLFGDTDEGEANTQSKAGE